MNLEYLIKNYCESNIDLQAIEIKLKRIRLLNENIDEAELLKEKKQIEKEILIVDKLFNPIELVEGMELIPILQFITKLQCDVIGEKYLKHNFIQKNIHVAETLNLKNVNITSAEKNGFNILRKINSFR